MSSTIKVLQVIPRLGFGGAETGCYDLAHFLAEQNCKSFIITSGGELLKFIRKDKVKIFRLPVHSKNPILMFINFIIISIIILIYNIDIVHARSRAPAWSCLLSCFSRNHLDFGTRYRKGSIILRKMCKILGESEKT